MPRCTNVDSHHITLKIWHIETRHRYFLLKNAYNVAHSGEDDLLDRRDIRTRLHDGIPFVIPSWCSTKCMKSFAYVSKMLWNCLGPEVQFLPTIEDLQLIYVGCWYRTRLAPISLCLIDASKLAPPTSVAVAGRWCPSAFKLILLCTMLSIL